MIITIARQLGSGREEDVGRLVAKRLDLLYADREILLRAARAGNLSELALVVDDERAPTLMERIAAYSIRVSSPNWRAEPLTPDQARVLEGEYATHGQPAPLTCLVSAYYTEFEGTGTVISLWPTPVARQCFHR